MSSWRRLLHRFTGRSDRDLDRELRAHLDLEAEEQREAGLPASEARYAARRAFGNVTLIKEDTRAVWGWTLLERFGQDALYAMRMMRKNPGFTAVAVLTLGLGIGANSAIFSIVSGVLLKPLDYHEPERLVTLLHGGRNPVAPADFLDWRAQSRSFENMAAAEAWGGILTGLDRPEDISGIRFGEGMFEVLGVGYFRTMGIPVMRGRDFTAQDTSDSPLVAIINEGFASRHLAGADPVGQRVTLDDPNNNPKWRTIVGVVKDVKQWSWTDQADDEIYLPFSQSSYRSSAVGQYTAMTLVVRTAVDPSDVSGPVQEAVWSLNRSAAVSSVSTLNQVIANILWQPRFNLILLGLFAILALLLGAVGVYGVMAYTVTQRTHEIGIRMALGAHKSDVLRLVVSQGMRLTLTGVLIGVAAACALSRALTRLLFEVEPLDPVTFAAVPLVLAVAALLACWLPARRASRIDPMTALRYE